MITFEQVLKNRMSKYIVLSIFLFLVSVDCFAGVKSSTSLKEDNVDGVLKVKLDDQSWGDDNINFSLDEKEYMSRKKEIIYCMEDDGLPLMGVLDGLPDGLTIDYIKILQNKISIPFRPLISKAWSESLSNFHKGKCDIIPAMVSSKSRMEYFNFTTPYISSDVVMVTRGENDFVSNFNKLKNVKVGVINNYALDEIVEKYKSNIEFYDVDSIEHGLYLVQSGELFGYIDSVDVVSIVIRHRYQDLSINGDLRVSWDIRMASRKNDPTLGNILEKALGSIDLELKDDVYKDWFSVNYNKTISILYFKELIIIVFVVFSFVVYRYFLLRSYNKKLQVISFYDSLTNIYNRRMINEFLTVNLNAHKRKGTPFSVILCDVDHFKHINDTYGHLVGDDVLVSMSNTLKMASRASDILGRWGGEEFLIICPDTKLKNAKNLANRLKELVSSTKYSHDVKVTMSFGVAELDSSQTLEDLLRRADKALYTAKSTGRNKICIACAD